MWCSPLYGPIMYSNMFPIYFIRGKKTRHIFKGNEFTFVRKKGMILLVILVILLLCFYSLNLGWNCSHLSVCSLIIT